MFPLFYIIVSLLVVLPDVYIRWVCLRGIDLGWWNLLFWAPLAFFVFLLVMYFAGGPQPFVFKGCSREWCPRYCASPCRSCSFASSR